MVARAEAASGGMNKSADTALVEAMAALERALSGLGRPHMLIGGLAVIARGVPRDTDDIDATVWADGLDLDELFAALAAQEIVPRIADARQFAAANQVLLLVHAPTGTPIEVSLGWLPFEADAMRSAERIRLGAVELPVALATDLVVYKAVAWRDRDRSDIERLLRLHRNSIDLERIRDLVRQFAEALDEPERVTAFEELVRRVSEED